MRPVLFELFGLEINSYGVSKALAAMLAGILLTREFRRLGWDEDRAWTLVWAATFLGFAGAKLYYLAEQGGRVSPHDLGSAGFTWYGGFLAGTLTVLLLARRWGLPWRALAGALAAPLAAAYGVGRLGCFLSGDGTYGQPSDLPWAMSFPNGTVPTQVPVHPTALYEAVGALLLAILLWRIRRTVAPMAVFGLYAVGSGATRLLIEELRVNTEGWLGLTQPQWWSLALMIVGTGLLIRQRRVEPLADAPAPKGTADLNA
ncbi:Phosphatidylglycerol--prolipoprotein diacylglyceryl transferase [Nocardioides sp. T2.26MG-1]|nr:Phosphatidylglycerol--prolipoprotein diacylglyceryl transferase [Nocardioides sp. T2.26MG-1]